MKTFPGFHSTSVLCTPKFDPVRFVLNGPYIIYMDVVYVGFAVAKNRPYPFSSRWVAKLYRKVWLLTGLWKLACLAALRIARWIFFSSRWCRLILPLRGSVDRLLDGKTYCQVNSRLALGYLRSSAKGKYTEPDPSDKSVLALLKTMKRIFTLALIILVTLMSQASCGDLYGNYIVPDEEAKFAEEYITRLRNKDFTYIKGLMSKDILNQITDDTLNTMAGYFWGGDLLSTELKVSMAGFEIPVSINIGFVT